MARQQIYRKLSVLFYEKDKELVEELEKLSIEREDSMSKIVKQLISKELELHLEQFISAVSHSREFLEKELMYHH